MMVSSLFLFTCGTTYLRRGLRSSRLSSRALNSPRPRTVRTGSSLSLAEDDDNDGDDDDAPVTVLLLAEEEESSLLLATLRRLMSGSSRSLSLPLDDVEDDDDEEEEARLSLLLGSRSPAGSRLTVAVNCGSSLRVAGDGSFGDSPPSGVVLRRLASLRSLLSLALLPPLLASRASLLLRRLRVLSDELALRSSDYSLRLTGLPPLEQHQHTKDNGAAGGQKEVVVPPPLP